MNQDKTIQPIYVSRPALPPLSDYVSLLENIWKSRIVTNNGPFVLEFEKKLAEYLDVPFVTVFTNGTLALSAALQTIPKEGHVITTPFSFVATTHVITLNGSMPVFCDIEDNSYNLSAQKVEQAIDKNTVAVLPVHCYGFPCDVQQFAEIGRKHRLPVIYDAAHAFGVKNEGISLLGAGDLAIVSFHATKVFSTFEGGAVISFSKETRKKIEQVRNFGIQDEITILGVGGNGKMNEVQAALGMLQLRHIGDYITKRHTVYEYYLKKLSEIRGISIYPVKSGIEYNYSYMPVLITEEFPITRNDLYDRLRSVSIYARRYFYPLLSNIPMYASLSSAHVTHLPQANRVAEQVLCLPIYPDLNISDVKRICNIIIENSL